MYISLQVLLGEKDMRIVGETMKIGDYTIKNVKAHRNPKKKNQWANVSEYR